jgi:hypothetical protein
MLTMCKGLREYHSIELLDSVLEVVLKYPDKCPYGPYLSKTRCPVDNRDKLIRYVYGDYSTAAYKAAQKGKIKLGKTSRSACEPHYYCPVHDRDL